MLNDKPCKQRRISFMSLMSMPYHPKRKGIKRIVDFLNKGIKIAFKPFIFYLLFFENIFFY